MIGKIGAGIFLGLSGLTVWAMWFPFKTWCFAQIPPNQYSGLIKIAMLILIGYFGGIGIPIIFIVLAFMCLQAFERS